MLKIDGYSQTKRLFGTGSFATSDEFEAANGIWSDSADHIALCIRFPGNVRTATISAKIRFSLVPHDDGSGKPEPYGKSFTAQYQGSGLSHREQGIPCFIKRQELEKSEYLVDDCFAIRC